MGVEPTAVVDHSLSWDELVHLPELLKAEWSRSESPLRALREPVEPSRFSWRWRLSEGFSSAAEELFDARHARFESPCGLWGTAFRHALDLQLFATWWSFVRDPAARAAVVAGVERVARLARGTVVIYLPDNGYTCSEARELLYAGQSVEEILAWLKRECGAPAEKASDLYAETPEGWTADGYVVQILGGAVEHGGAADKRR